LKFKTLKMRSPVWVLVSRKLKLISRNWNQTLRLRKLKLRQLRLLLKNIKLSRIMCVIIANMMCWQRKLNSSHWKSSFARNA
jgi:Putative zinc ribbon domain